MTPTMTVETLAAARELSLVLSDVRQLDDCSGTQSKVVTQTSSVATPAPATSAVPPSGHATRRSRAQQLVRIGRSKTGEWILMAKKYCKD